MPLSPVTPAHRVAEAQRRGEAAPVSVRGGDAVAAAQREEPRDPRHVEPPVGGERPHDAGIAACRVELHVFKQGQNWTTMLGYIWKDRDKTHFRNLAHNIDNDEVKRGISEWTSLKLSYEDDKIVLNKKNFFVKARAMSSYYLHAITCIPHAIRARRDHIPFDGEPQASMKFVLAG